jgi:hypothetical protein
VLLIRLRYRGASETRSLTVEVTVRLVLPLIGTAGFEPATP